MHDNFIMSNFYTEEDQPLRKVRAVTFSQDILLTQQTQRSPVPALGLRESPLWTVTKLLLG
jgi:hypothetical protein